MVFKQPIGKSEVLCRFLTTIYLNWLNFTLGLEIEQLYSSLGQLFLFALWLSMAYKAHVYASQLGRKTPYRHVGKTELGTSECIGEGRGRSQIQSIQWEVRGEVGHCEIDNLNARRKMLCMHSRLMRGEGKSSIALLSIDVPLRMRVCRSCIFFSFAIPLQVISLQSWIRLGDYVRRTNLQVEISEGWGGIEDHNP